MKIQYDKDFEKVMNELQANFGWSNIDELPDSYKDLLNDTIKAVKNCSIPAVVVRSEQLSCPRCGHTGIDTDKDGFNYCRSCSYYFRAT